MNTDDLRRLMPRILQRPIALHRIFMDVAGSATGGIFLSQLFYWSDKGKDPDGWLYKTQEEWTAEVGLTRSEQERARKGLRERGVLEESRRGVPSRLFYRLNADALAAAISTLHDPASYTAGGVATASTPDPDPQPTMQDTASNDGQFPHPTMQDRAAWGGIVQARMQDRADKDAGSCSLHTETTTETTQRGDGHPVSALVGEEGAGAAMTKALHYAATQGVTGRELADLIARHTGPTGRFNAAAFLAACQASRQKRAG